LFINLLLLAWIPIIYFGFQLYQTKARGCARGLLLLLWGGLALLDFASKRKYYADYLRYLRLGDVYVMERTCLVTDAHAPTPTALVYATQHLQCADGTSLTLRYRRDYQRIYPKVGRAFRVRYLPKSGLVVELEPLDADDRERPRGEGEATRAGPLARAGRVLWMGLTSANFRLPPRKTWDADTTGVSRPSATATTRARYATTLAFDQPNPSSPAALYDIL
ncbi:MAG: hypothetical protein GXO37_00300, partial [Chloroflexi bacterium]|nr:hypothetical protein [Chloroflexota bacterium]